MSRITSAIAAAAILLLVSCGRPAQEGDKQQTSQRPDHFERKRICMEIGNRIYERESKNAEESRLVGAERYGMLNPEYCYSESLNTCLYAGGIVSKNYQEEWVRDSFTNRDVVDSIISDGRVMSGVPKVEFERTRRELMAGCAK